jgi:hypothetical protein
MGRNPAPAPARRTVSRSNAAGQIISAPKMTSSTRPAVRNASGSKCKAVAMALSASATKANDATKPAAMKAGRAPARCPIDAPSKIGSTGRVQGAAMVRMHEAVRTPKREFDDADHNCLPLESSLRRDGIANSGRKT